MRTFAQKQNQPQQPASSILARPNVETYGSNHHTHPIQHWQRTIDNQAGQRLLQDKAEEFKEGAATTTATRFAHDFSRIPVHSKSLVTIQTKLAVNSPGDSYEQEADSIAEQVSGMTEPQLQRSACAYGGERPKCTANQTTQEHKLLQPKHLQSDGAEKTEAPPIVHDVLNSAGEPLDSATRAFMEPRFNYDFSRVRVHTNSKAAESARAVNALAYTVGYNVVFGDGQHMQGANAFRRLLAHELTHVVQQQGGVSAPIIQRKDDKSPKPDPKKDAQTVLGERLWKEFPNGVAVAIYADPDPWNAKPEAEEWAKRENAIGTRGKTITAKDLIFGQAISEKLAPLSDIVNTLSNVLSASVAKAPKPAGIVPQPGSGPSSIRSLALFAHGEPFWIGVGKEGFFLSSTSKLIKKMAPSLVSNVNVTLFACGVARGQKEKETWIKGTMESGGGDSLASVVRDALLEQGKKTATVWGHEAGGNVTHNPTLRQFTADAGKGAQGTSYASTFIFTDAEKNAAIADLKKRIITLGYGLGGDSDKFEQIAKAELTLEMYWSYIEANESITFQKGSLAETAPEHPREVGELVRKYWKETYWPAHKDKVADRLVKSLNLKNAPRGRYRDSAVLDD